MFTWGVSAALSTVAGILVAPLLALSPYFMNLVLIRAFAAALLGGFTSLGGALVGGVLVGVVESHIQRYTEVRGRSRPVSSSWSSPCCCCGPTACSAPGRPKPTRRSRPAGGA